MDDIVATTDESRQHLGLKIILFKTAYSGKYRGSVI